MQRRINVGSSSVVLIFLLIFGIFWRLCASQASRGEADAPPDGHGGDGGPFFALRSCHQLLHGRDAGEFFSPDYLCSNPPLWCNWTIQVDPGKRVHLHLEDMTPDDDCHLKEDQVHVDEPTGRFRGHKFLQKCWREAKYTSSSNTVNVVLLIKGWPNPPYRGFYGRFQAFGPPVVYNPHEEFTDRIGKSDLPVEPMDLNELGVVMNGEQAEFIQHHPSDLTYDYYDQPSAMTAELPFEAQEDDDTEVDENHHPASTSQPTVPAPTQGTSRSGRGATQTPSGPSDSTIHLTSPQQPRDGLQPTTRTPTAIRRNVEEASTHPEDEETSAYGEAQLPAPSEEPEETHPHPNMVEPLSDHRGNHNIRNHSDSPHLPGNHLFEVAVEVNFSQDVDESWDDQARSLLLSVKALIIEQLRALHTPPSMSSKRIKRLNGGVLFILWLQVGQQHGGLQVHRAVHAALQGLIAMSVTGNGRRAVITSVSTADVNECGTQLVLCDINADCVNWFGSYSCHCRPGFRDESRVGSGGTVCVDVEATGCSSGLSAETKGVYVLFFLLSSLVLMLLVAAAMLYHRHRRGAFLVRCHTGSSGSPPDANNNHRHQEDSYSTPADSDLPPPPPPARGFREGWPQVKERCPPVDLPLLRFSPLLPPDSYMGPQDGEKM